MSNTQLISSPFHDEDSFSGWCPDCGLQQCDLVVNEVRICEDCACKFTFAFKQLEGAATNDTT